MAKKKYKKYQESGRPLKYQSVEELQTAIDEYFTECKEHRQTIVTKQGQVLPDQNVPQIPTIAGLAYKLGISRQTLYSYNENDIFLDTITRARDYILTRVEQKCMNVDGNISGTIFLAQNYGYSTNAKTEHSGNIDSISDEELDTKINEYLKKRQLDR